VDEPQFHLVVQDQILHSLQHVEAVHVHLVPGMAETAGGPVERLSQALPRITDPHTDVPPQAITQPSEYQVGRIIAITDGDPGKYERAVLSIDGRGKGHFTFADAHEIPILSAGTTGDEGDHIVFQSLNQRVSGSFSFPPRSGSGEVALIDHDAHVRAAAHKGRAIDSPQGESADA
jgi:hypothetical protein